MEKLALTSTNYLVLANSATAIDLRIRRWPAYRAISVTRRRRVRESRGFRCAAFSVRHGLEGGDEASQRISKIVQGKVVLQKFASISSSNRSAMSTVSTFPPASMPPPPTYFGSPLFWVGVGVGLSALFSMVAAKVKQYAMQQAFKTMMSQAAPQNDQFSNAAFQLGSPFPFASQSPSAPIVPPKPRLSSPAVGSSFQFASQSPSAPVVPPIPSPSTSAGAVADVPAKQVEDTTLVEKKEKTENNSNKFAFVDVSPEEVLKKDSEYVQELKEPLSQSESVPKENGAATSAITQKPDVSSQQSHNGASGSVLSVEVLEKMMEDPNVQNMVYRYLPEEMRNPATFKWMLQNPQYRQQLQDMLSSMGGSSEWDNNLMESLKNFDLSSPEVKKQFDQIGLTPEEVISKLMANPDVALAFQNPKVQAAMMECSQNPLSIAKYQNDKEVMDVFAKISELFPGMIGKL